MLELRSVSFRYSRGAFAIENLSASVAAGELISIAGPNGSGKSTLLRLIARVLHPTSGDILMDGASLRAWDPRSYAQTVGYLPQTTDTAFPERAIDVVVSGRAPFLHRLQWESNDDLDRALAALGQCDAAHLAHSFVDELSGGEQKRVFLARVLVGNPRLLLLDEPFAALDLNHIQQLMGRLRGFVTRTGGSVIVVSHDLNWSAAFSDRMLVMSGGRMVAGGPPAEVLSSDLLEKYFAFRGEAVEVPGSGRRWIVPKI